jgi:hypothetical protein
MSATNRHAGRIVFIFGYCVRVSHITSQFLKDTQTFRARNVATHITSCVKYWKHATWQIWQNHSVRFQINKQIVPIVEKHAMLNARGATPPCKIEMQSMLKKLYNAVWNDTMLTPSFTKIGSFSGSRLIDGGKVVSPTRRPLFTPRKIPGTHFC